MKVVKDTLKVQDPRDPKNDEAKIEVEVEYQEAETLADCATWSGSEENAVKFFNAAANAKATNTGKLKELAGLDAASSESAVVAAMKRLAEHIKNYVPSVGRTGASAVKFVDALKSKLADSPNLTRNDIADLAREFGITV